MKLQTKTILWDIALFSGGCGVLAYYYTYDYPHITVWWFIGIGLVGGGLGVFWKHFVSPWLGKAPNA